MTESFGGMPPVSPEEPIKEPEGVKEAKFEDVHEEKPPEQPAEREFSADSVEKEFERIFNIKKEELESVKGFTDLPLGQQILVLENLKQVTLGRIEDEAVDRYNKGTIERVSKYTAAAEDAKFLSKIWSRTKAVAAGGWRGALRGFYVAREEKRTAEEILHGGMAIHGDELQFITNGMAASGPEVLVLNKEGKIEVLYAGEFDDLTYDEQGLVIRFNKTAGEFAEIPQEWSLPSATKRQQNEYNKAKEKYEASIDGILPLKQRALGNEQDAALAVANIERKVLFNQLLSHSPDVERRLKDIESNEVWARALNNVITERGLYAGFGYAARAATTSVLSLFAAPAVAAIVGGHIARRRALETLRQEEKLGRRGAKEDKAEIAGLKNESKAAKEAYKSAQGEYEKYLAGLGLKLDDIIELDEGRLGVGSEVSLSEEQDQQIVDLRQKAELALQNASRAEAVLKDKQGGEKAFVDASSLENKINSLSLQLDWWEMDDEKRAKTLGSLQARIDYTYDKIDKGLVNFGKTAEEQFMNKYSLLSKLSYVEAQVAVKGNELAEVKGLDGLTVTERLNRLVGAREARVTASEKKFIRQQMIRGAIMGAGFAVLGYSIRHFFSGSPKNIEASHTVKGAPTEAPDAGTPYENPKPPIDAAHVDSMMADNLMKNGVPPKALFEAGVPRDTLIQAGVPKDTVHALVADSVKAGRAPADTLRAMATDTVKAEKVPADSVLGFIKQKFSFFANDSTFHKDSTGAIVRQGWPGNYSVDKNGDIIFSGGTGPDGKEYAAQILKAGSKAEHWVEAKPGVGVKPEQLELAGIKKGEGVWHAVHRQLEEQCKKDPSKFNLKPEELKDAAKLRAVLNKETARILVENKVLKPDGSEIRIRDIGTKVILRDGGKVEITDGKTYDWHPPKVKEEFSAPLKGLRDTQWIDNQRSFLLGKPSLLEKAGTSRWLVSDAAETYKGAVGELNNAVHVRGLTALEQEELLATARHGAAQLDQWGLKPGTGGSFMSHFESVLKKSEMSELSHRNINVYNDISKRVSSTSGIEWAKAGRMRVSDMMRWHKEPDLDMKPGTFRLVEAVSKLNPTKHDQTLTLDEFLKSRIHEGKTDFLKVLESTPKAPVDVIGAHHDELNSFVHGLARENLNELKANIPRYATVLNAKPEDIEHAFTELGKTKDVVGNLSKFAAEHPDQARLLSKVLEAEPDLKPEGQALKHALDGMIDQKAPGVAAVVEEQLAQGEIPIKSENMDGFAKFTYSANHEPATLIMNISSKNSTGAELFKENWRSSLVAENAGKSNLSLLESKVPTNGSLLSKYLAIYDKISKNPSYQKETSLLVGAMRRIMKSITNDAGDIIDTEKLPEVLRPEK